MRNVFFTIIAVVFVFTGSAFSQSSITNTTEGVSNDIDKKRRSPNVSVTTQFGEDVVKLLVSAYIPNEEYRKYPIQFDFFINREWYAAQFFSPELPGAVGVEVPSTVATVPFNFTVVAKVLHPNREFTSVFIGAALPTKLAATLDCTLSKTESSPDDADEDEESDEEEGSDEEESTTAEELLFVGNDVAINEGGNSQITLNFEADDSTAQKHAEIDATVTVTVSDSTASGDLTFDLVGEEGETFEVSGTVTLQNNVLTEIKLSSEGGEVELSCS